MKVNLSNVIFSENVEYSDHHVDVSGIHPNTENVDAIVHVLEPTNMI